MAAKNEAYYYELIGAAAVEVPFDRNL